MKPEGWREAICVKNQGQSMPGREDGTCKGHEWVGKELGAWQRERTKKGDA